MSVPYPHQCDHGSAGRISGATGNIIIDNIAIFLALIDTVPNKGKAGRVLPKSKTLAPDVPFSGYL